jgi:hypothetical protein
VRLTEFLNLGLLEVFAETITNRQNAIIVLSTIGFPAHSVPRTPQQGGYSAFWLQVCREIEAGILPDGPDLQPLVNAAFRRYPTNPKLREFVTSSPKSVGNQTKSIPKLFISYSRRDKVRVAEIVSELRNLGIECWIDEKDVTNEQPYIQQLESAIESCDAILVFVGPQGIGKWQNMETNVAIDLHASHSKEIFPVMLNPSVRIESIPLFLRQFNAFTIGSNEDIHQLAERVRSAFLGGKNN